MKIVMQVLKLYLPKENILIVQDLWRAHYQILLITSKKEFIKDCDCFLQYERTI